MCKAYQGKDQHKVQFMQINDIYPRAFSILIYLQNMSRN